MSGVTRILNSISRRDPQASEQLFTIVYEELRQMAMAKLAREASGHTLQPTALVHEAYLRLVGDDEASWDSRGHFFAAAAEAMRRILVDAAHRKLRIKHGGDRKRVPLTDSHKSNVRPPHELLLVDETLERFFEVDQQAAQLVKLHYFGGFSIEEAAGMLGISTRTAYRDWAFARAWFRRQIDGPRASGEKR